MKLLLKNLGDIFEALPDVLRQRRIVVWILFLALSVGLAVGVGNNKFDMTLGSWFSDDDPTKVALNQFKSYFGSDESIYLVYKPKDGDLFSRQSLESINGIREELLGYNEDFAEDESSMLGHITKVDSIASSKILKADDGVLVAKRFIGNDYPLTEKDKEILKQDALKQRNFPLYFFSEGFQYGAMVIQTDLGTEPLDQGSEDFDFDAETGLSDSNIDFTIEPAASEADLPVDYKPIEMAEYVSLMNDINEIILQSKYADHLEYFPVGNPPAMTFFMKQLEEMGPIFVAMIVVMILLLWGLFRSFSAVAWSTLLVTFSCVWTLGVSGWMGSTITGMVSLTIMLILAVGMADAIHIISGYMLFRKGNKNHREALRMAYGKAALPCLLTTVTTAVGMLTLTLSSISHIQTFGYMSAMGVVFAFCFTILVLPLMLDLWGPVTGKSKPVKKRWFNIEASALIQRLLKNVLPLVEKSPILVVGIFMLVFLTCIYGASQVKIDSNMIEAAKEGTILRINYDIVDNHMAGTQNMEILIDGGSTESLLNPRILKAMDQLQKTIEDKYPDLVARTFSLANVTKDAYQVLNEGKEEFYMIPGDSRSLAQTLFMFDNANPEDRRKLVSDNYEETHISIQLFNAGSYKYTGFIDEVQKDIDIAFAGVKKDYPDLQVSITGSLALLMKLADYIGWSQVKSLGSVILIISLMMVFIFGSYRVGLISIIPNLIPATLTFGLLGLLGLALDSDTIIIAPVIIGIAVDDTIHFITHYREEVIKDDDVRRAIISTLQEVGQAIFFTTLILGLGFFMMTFSSNTSLIKVGVFGSLAIFVALLCDLFLLPALMLVFKPKFARRAQKQALKTLQVVKS